MLKYNISKKVIFALIILISISSSYIFLDEKEKQKIQLALVFNNLQQLHFSPPAIDDKFSHKVFNLYIKQIDYSKRFLTSGDSTMLAVYKNKLDDELRSNEFEFFEKINEVYEERLKLVSSFYKDYLSAPMDFTVDEKIQLEATKRHFAKDEAILKEQWRKYLKYQALIYINGKLDIQEGARTKGDTSVKIKSFEALEIEARAKILKDHEEMFKRLQRETKSERFAEYINAIVHVFDPHSDYFPPKEKENFDIQMSGKLEGIGATLQEKDGYIKVQSIVPGSPCYKQGDLKPEDFILKVAQGDEEPVDIVDMRLDNAVKLIRGKKGTTVKLTIKKPDGAIKVISIVRDVVVMEEAYAKSIIVNDTKNNQKIGYISLPSFYADFNDINGRTCSQDIKNELIKLKAEKVDGIVIDLRNNGGGSLNDVVTMGGFFIDSGPIVQVKGREAVPYILGDEDPSVIYDGPLVILINQFSASASEILAAAMQDYKRAVIIGSSSSFGKGTVQRFYDIQAPRGIEALGSAKITTQKFYRITGGSTQLKGVVPNIILPDLYRYLDLGEKEMDYALPWDQIPASSYEAFQQKSFDIETIQKKSKARIDKNETFAQISKNAEYLKFKQNNTHLTLNLKAYQADQLALKKEEENFKKEEKEITDWDFAVLKSDAPPQADSVSAVKTKNYIKTLKKDIYLYEAVQVIKDIRKE
jgi:carboxyl-terminal processing protease